MLFSCGIARPQSPASRETVNNSHIVPIKIGDQIPDELWNLPLQVVNHPQGKKTATLSEFKEKLIILDFWSTWCSPCIRNFPKLHALENHFGDKVKVLAVTPEDKGKIVNFFTNGAGKEYSYVNSVVNDSILSSYFPHQTVPHIVWISPDGLFINTTQAEEITKENIQQILQGQTPALKAKVDIDQDKPLFLSDHFGNDMELKAYSIFAKGYYPGLPSGGSLKKTHDGKIYGRQGTNLPIMDIYFPILHDLFLRNGENFSLKRTIINVKQPTLLMPILKSDGTFEGSNLYNYELVVPETNADSLSFFMLVDLNRYSDYTGTIENRLVDCIVLVRTSTKDKIRSKGGKPKFYYSTTHSKLSNRPLSYLLKLVNSDTYTDLPIIDETGYEYNIDIEISGIDNLASLKRELNKYDLDLVTTKRRLDMFVLKDK